MKKLLSLTLSMVLSLPPATPLPAAGKGPLSRR